MKPKPNLARQIARYSELGMLLPASTIVGYIIGYVLDKWLATTYLYLVFLLLGIAAGFVQLIRELNKDGSDGKS
ncbi:MAG TPA: AtpZ/AtpI family protein [Bryobacteraceae bacterium]|nr:AtpZ/AtpI family protein [Bryobacteraceae bacterium]